MTEPFDFLEDKVNITPSLLPAPTGLREEYNDNSFIKFGKLIINIKKVDLALVVAKEIMSVYGEGVTRREYLYTYIEKYLPELLTIDTARVAQLVAERSGSQVFAELREIIEMDKKYSRAQRRR